MACAPELMSIMEGREQGLGSLHFRDAVDAPVMVAEYLALEETWCGITGKLPHMCTSEPSRADGPGPAPQLAGPEAAPVAHLWDGAGASAAQCLSSAWGLESSAWASDCTCTQDTGNTQTSNQHTCAQRTRASHNCTLGACVASTWCRGLQPACLTGPLTLLCSTPGSCAKRG